MTDHDIAMLTQALSKPNDHFIYNDDILLGYLIALERIKRALKELNSSFNDTVFFASISHGIHGKEE